MRNRRSYAVSVALVLWAIQGAAADWTARLDKALEQELAKVSIQGQSLPEALKAFRTWTGVNVTLDPKAAEAVRDVKIDFQARKMTARNVLGNLLRLAGGLRYTYADGSVYVSTAARVADKLTATPSASPVESRPMTVPEAAARRMSRETLREDPVLGVGIIDYARYPYAPRPRTNPATGLTDYPAPYYITETEDFGDRRFWFTTQPYFVKPEYRGLVPQSLSDSVRTEVVRSEQDGEADRLKRLLRDNPDLTARQILEKLRQER